MVSVKTIGRKIDYSGNFMPESTAYFWHYFLFQKFHWNQNKKQFFSLKKFCSPILLRIYYKKAKPNTSVDTFDAKSSRFSNSDTFFDVKKISLLWGCTVNYFEPWWVVILGCKRVTWMHFSRNSSRVVKVGQGLKQVPDSSLTVRSLILSDASTLSIPGSSSV